MSWEVILGSSRAMELKARERELANRAAYAQAREVDRLQGRLEAARSRISGSTTTPAQVH